MQHLSEWQALTPDDRLTPEQVDRLLLDLGVTWTMVDEDMLDTPFGHDAITYGFRFRSRDARGRCITATFRQVGAAGPLAPLAFGRDHPTGMFPNAAWILMELPKWGEDQDFRDWLEGGLGAERMPRPGSDLYRFARREYMAGERHWRSMSRFWDAVQARLDAEGIALAVWPILDSIC